jgi:hypothetical protein
MLVALMADMHGNREAFAARLDHAERGGAQRFAFLGDAVGYGADPRWVTQTVMDRVGRGAARAGARTRGEPARFVVAKEHPNPEIGESRAPRAAPGGVAGKEKGRGCPALLLSSPLARRLPAFARQRAPARRAPSRGEPSCPGPPEPNQHQRPKGLRRKTSVPLLTGRAGGRPMRPVPGSSPCYRPKMGPGGRNLNRKGAFQGALYAPCCMRGTQGEPAAPKRPP